MTLTYRRLSTFINAASVWLQANPAGHEKFAYALKKVLKQARIVFETYEAAREDIKITHAAVDAEGILKRDTAGILQYTPEGLKGHNADVLALQHVTVSMKPHVVADADLPELSEDYRDAFEGIVIEAGDGFKIVPHVQESDPEMVYDILTDTKIKASDRHFNPEMVDA